MTLPVPLAVDVAEAVDWAIEAGAIWRAAHVVSPIMRRNDFMVFVRVGLVVKAALDIRRSLRFG